MVTPLCRVKNLDHLRKQRDPRIERNVFSAQTGRFSAPVPVFVQAADAVSHLFVEPKLQRDIGTTLATRRDQFSGELLAVPGQIQDAIHPFVQRLADTAMRHHETSKPRQAVGIHQLEIAFNQPVVGAVQLEQPRGIAAAAGVLQQQRVVKMR